MLGLSPFNPFSKIIEKTRQNAQRVGPPCRQMPPWIRTKSPGKKQGFHWVVLFEDKRNIARFCWISCLNTRKLNTLYFGPLSLRNISFVSMFRIIRNSFCFPHKIYIYIIYIYIISTLTQYCINHTYHIWWIVISFDESMTSSDFVIMFCFIFQPYLRKCPQKMTSPKINCIL